MKNNPTRVSSAFAAIAFALTGPALAQQGQEQDQNINRGITGNPRTGAPSGTNIAPAGSTTDKSGATTWTEAERQRAATKNPDSGHDRRTDPGGPNASRAGDPPRSGSTAEKKTPGITGGRGNSADNDQTPGGE